MNLTKGISQKNPEYLLEDEEILAAQNNSKMFEAVYNRHYESLVRFIYQRVNTKQEAFEISSKIFCNALKKVKEFKFKELLFSNWLLRLAIKELNYLFKNNQLNRALNFDTQGLKEFAASINIKQQSDNLLQISAAITQLSLHEIMLIEMHCFEKRPMLEIAEILELSEQQVKLQIADSISKVTQFIHSK